MKPTMVCLVTSIALTAACGGIDSTDARRQGLSSASHRTASSGTGEEAEGTRANAAIAANAANALGHSSSTLAAQGGESVLASTSAATDEVPAHTGDSCGEGCSKTAEWDALVAALPDTDVSPLPAAVDKDSDPDGIEETMKELLVANSLSEADARESAFLLSKMQADAVNGQMVSVLASAIKIEDLLEGIDFDLSGKLAAGLPGGKMPNIFATLKSLFTAIQGKDFGGIIQAIQELVQAFKK